MGSNYTWRVVLFDALGEKFRLLIAFRTDLNQYEALLGLVEGSDTKAIASYEFHGTHDGWHIHANCDSFDRLKPGIKVSGREIRLPKAKARHRRSSFDVNDNNALDKAREIFGLPGQPAEQWELI